MIARINLIRHGKTIGNLSKRYIGATDEPLCPEGIRELPIGSYSASQAWFVSPLRRCLETAVLLSGEEAGQWTTVRSDRAIRKFLEGKNREIVADFRECNFGMFENKNYQELSHCPEYQRWVDSNGSLPFPHGEIPKAFRERCCKAFEQAVERICSENWREVCMVVHGGTIMSIMERYALPHRTYFDWRVKNGSGYLLLLEKEIWREQKEFCHYELQEKRRQITQY